MSFGQVPPKTPYGDQDFIKEDWTPQQPPPATPPSIGSPQASVPAYSNRYPQSLQNTPYSSLVPPAPSSDTLQQGPYGDRRQHPNQPEVANLVQSLTPEDQLFMRSWRRDSFFYRVLPLSALASGVLYFYNQSRNLPNKASRYLIVSFGAYVIGKWSYKGELKRRLESSPSNTPFMNALRELLGVRPPAFGGEFVSDIGQDYSGFGLANDVPQQMSAGIGSDASGYSQSRPPVTGHHQPPTQDQPNYLPYESDITLSAPNYGTTKPLTSYEELRARNRNPIQK